MSGILVRAARATRVQQQLRQQTRRLSGETAEAHQQHHAETAKTWEKWTYYTVPAIGLLGLYNVVAHFMHGHHEVDPPKYSYQHFRKKAFPWECSDCALFDGKCWAECKAAKQ